MIYVVRCTVDVCGEPTDAYVSSVWYYAHDQKKAYFNVNRENAKWWKTRKAAEKIAAWLGGKVEEISV